MSSWKKIPYITTRSTFRCSLFLLILGALVIIVGLAIALLNRILTARLNLVKRWTNLHWRNNAEVSKEVTALGAVTGREYAAEFTIQSVAIHIENYRCTSAQQSNLVQVVTEVHTGEIEYCAARVGAGHGYRSRCDLNVVAVVEDAIDAGDQLESICIDRRYIEIDVKTGNNLRWPGVELLCRHR